MTAQDPRKIAARLNIFVLLLIFWAVSPPHYYYPIMVLVLVALPWVAIRLKAKSPDIYRLVWRRKDPGPNISKLLIVPGFILMMRAYNDHNVIVEVALTVVVFIVSCLMNIAIYKADGANANEPPPIFTFQRALLAFLLLPYCYGFAVQVDVLLDIWPPQEYQVVVLDRYDWKTRWTVKVEPWEGMHEKKNVNVPRAMYDAVKSGDKVCVRQHVGALFIPWYELGMCKN